MTNTAREHASPLSLKDELANLLEASEGNLGAVYHAMQVPGRSLSDIASDAGIINQGYVSNLRSSVRVILGDYVPEAPTIAKHAYHAIGGLIRGNSNLSDECRKYLQDLRASLLPVFEPVEEEIVEAVETELVNKVSERGGIYVYSLPTFMRTSVDGSEDRHWFKVGMTERDPELRIKEQQRMTGLPEDPLWVRVYRPTDRSIRDIEKSFHRLLEAAGHRRAASTRGGTEWFATNIRYLDAIARELGLEISRNTLQNLDLEF